CASVGRSTSCQGGIYCYYYGLRSW
nr:immunoglobulin heavy chain junction region [Macaca mulatta]MOV56032.1 immunoglobulin heavy chain junction region [Macaca mulatta]MOV56933.1 immunoglobulin heavy chain junction region [Macaca mulatta]MOV57912.1 immunoglobulin heavy chain junction region [Macaca mulatta]MOV60035.1 immunoglobulin heavy chain junction region [Macaca mulatta]